MKKYIRKQKTPIQAIQFVGDNIEELMEFGSGMIAPEKNSQFMNAFGIVSYSKLIIRNSLMSYSPDKFTTASNEDYIIKSHSEELGWHLFKMSKEQFEDEYEKYVEAPDLSALINRMDQYRINWEK